MKHLTVDGSKNTTKHQKMKDKWFRQFTRSSLYLSIAMLLCNWMVICYLENAVVDKNDGMNWTETKQRPLRRSPKYHINT
jgi:hypothetical protein